MTIKMWWFPILLFFVSVTCQILHLPEGSKCEWKEAKGTCINIRRCPSAMEDFKHKDPPPICSFITRGTPVVCCTDCLILPEEDSFSDILDKPKLQSNMTYESKCLAFQYLLPYECKPHVKRWTKKYFSAENRCWLLEYAGMSPTGGEDAKRGDFPHMALLGYGEDLQSAQWLCGGSLISERHILTAAHCGSQDRLGEVRYVSLGMLKRSDTPSYWKQYLIKKFIPHPNYNSPSKYHDIAIIETVGNVNWTGGVYPACLTHKRDINYDDNAIATGWGSLGPRKPNADVMQKVWLKKLSLDQCKKLYPPFRNMERGIDDVTQVCYGDFDQPRDTCNGDSGGPLQMVDSDARTCIYVIIGVTSNGRPCSNTSVAGIYTRVHHYLPWIESVVWPGNKKTIRDSST